MDWRKWFADFPEWIAYYSPEIFIDDSLWPTAGGLGIVTHSALRVAHRLRIPLVGVTINWREGFCHQKLGPNGMEYEYTPHSDENLVDTGVKVKIQIGGNPSVLLKVWVIPPDVFETGPIICLDADIDENDAVSRQNTKKMYYGDAGQKLAQMIILGIGGARALQALSIKVKIHHLNDPHCAFVGIELLNQKMAEGLDFPQALAWTKEHVVFTTHTPVVIGDTHDLETMINLGCLGCFPNLNHESHLTREQVAFLGRNPFNEQGFSPIAFCLRTARIANAVSKLHAETSRQMLSWVQDGCPIIPITNGVYIPDWQLPEFREAKTPEALKEAKLKYKTLLFDEIRGQYVPYGVTKELKLGVMTVGWGRRPHDYKRPEFIRKLSLGGDQMIAAGKPNPLDFGMVRLWNELWQDSKTVANLAMLAENGYAFKKRMKAGVDLWLLTSRRPWEACEDCFMSAMLMGCLVMASSDGGPLEISSGRCFLYGLEHPHSAEEQDCQDLQEAKHLMPKISYIYYNTPKLWYRVALDGKEEAEEKFSATRMVGDYRSQMWAI